MTSQEVKERHENRHKLLMDLNEAIANLANAYDWTGAEPLVTQERRDNIHAARVVVEWIRDQITRDWAATEDPEIPIEEDEPEEEPYDPVAEHGSHEPLPYEPPDYERYR